MYIYIICIYYMHIYVYIIQIYIYGYILYIYTDKRETNKSYEFALTLSLFLQECNIQLIL